jgi:hypothetical protein
MTLRHEPPLSRKYEIILSRVRFLGSRSLYHWKNHLKAIEGGAADSPIRELRKQVRDLKRVLAEKTVEVDFFKGALQKIEARRQGNNGSGETASTNRYGK